MKKKKKRVVDIVSEIVEPFAGEKGLELVDVEFVKEGPDRYLRVIIDKEEGVSIDDCGEVSLFLSKKMDELDPIEENYFLEVTSPGVERQLKKDKDFERFSGKAVQVNLYQPIDGQKILEGILLGLFDNAIKLEMEEGQVIEIPKSKASLVKLVVKFD